MATVFKGTEWSNVLFEIVKKEWKRHYILMDMMYRGDSIKDYGYDDERR